MKFLKPITFIIICCVTSLSAQQYNKDKKLKESETITTELEFKTKSLDHMLVVDNVYGSIDVKGYNGTKILVEVTKTIYADRKEDLKKGKNEIGIKSAQKGDAIYVYLDSPYSHFDIETGNFEYREFDNNYRKNYKNGSKRAYNYSLNFKIKVPKNTSINVKAANNGNVIVENIHSKLLTVHNINGAIDMNNVSGKTDVNALNKDINITYAENPIEESWYRSLNGDINIKFKNDLDAIISYKTINGQLNTNFDIEKTKPKIIKTEEGQIKNTKYKINVKSQFIIGKGKIALHFDQLNGNGNIKK